MIKEASHRVNYGAPAKYAARAAAVILTVLLFITVFPLCGLSKEDALADSSEIVTLSLDGTFIIDATRGMLNNINDLRANDAWYWNESDTEKVYLTNLAPLEYDYELERVAMQRAAELAVYYGHTRPNGTSCFTAYPDGFRTMGENIAAGQPNADYVFNAWAEADEPYAGQGHRRNMLNTYFTAVGIGCFEYNGYLYWAQEFGSKTTASSNPLASPASIDVLKSRISEAALNGKNRIAIGGSVHIPEICLSITGSFPSNSIIRLPVREEDCRLEDTSIAAISDGKIVGLEYGETTLTVTYDSLTLSTSITVSEDTTIPLSPGESQTVTISEGETVYFRFTPAETKTYTFYSSGEYDTVGYLYDSDMEELSYNDDGGENCNFSIMSQLTENTLYYYAVRFYSSGDAGSVTVTLRQDTSFISEGFTYRLLDDGTASIINYSMSGDIVIPDTLDGHTVTNLTEELFYGKSNVTSVTIPATVTFFGTDRNDNDWDYVFSYCYNLENIFVESENPVFKSVDGVLYSKNGNTLINYPCRHEGEIYHADAARLCCTSFASCRNLRFLFLDNPNTTWFTYTFYNAGGVTVFYNEGGATENKIAGDTSSPCTFVSVNNIAELPAQLEVIEAEAFRNTDLRYVRIPDGCRRIETGAFTGANPEYISVGSATVIEDGAFGSTAAVERR